jgi:hypothetical protein
LAEDEGGDLKEIDKDSEKERELSPDSLLRGHHNSITRVMLGTTDATSSILLSASSDTTIRVRVLPLAELTYYEAKAN